MRRINVAGNTRTRDEVVRREIRQMEGGWYTNTKIRRSKERLDPLAILGCEYRDTTGAGCAGSGGHECQRG